MIAIENRNGLMCSYDTETQEFRTFDGPEELRRFLEESGITEVHYHPRGPWFRTPGSVDYHAQQFRWTAGHAARRGKNGPRRVFRDWVAIPVSRIADGQPLVPRS